MNKYKKDLKSKNPRFYGQDSIIDSIGNNSMFETGCKFNYLIFFEEQTSWPKLNATWPSMPLRLAT